MKTEDLHAELTFGDGALNLSALGDDILVVDAVLLLDQVVTVAVLVSGGGRVALGSHCTSENTIPITAQTGITISVASSESNAILAGTVAPFPCPYTPENAQSQPHTTN